MPFPLVSMQREPSCCDHSSSPSAEKNKKNKKNNKKEERNRAAARSVILCAELPFQIDFSRRAQDKHSEESKRSRRKKEEGEGSICT